MEMLIVSLVGLSFIGLGFLVVKYPMLISGYNTMSKENRKKVDIRKVSLLIRKSFIMIGVIIIAGAFLLNGVGWKNWISLLMIATLLCGPLILMIRMQRLFPELYPDKLSKISIWIVAVITVIAAAALVCESIPVNIKVADKTLTISGSYGISIPLQNINRVERVESLPAIKMKTNGFAMGNMQKGHFQVDKLGSCRLFLNTHQGPFLIIYTEGNTPVIINRNNADEINALYNQINP